jgi:hypothetical protein
MRHYTWNGSKQGTIDESAINSYPDAATGEAHQMNPNANDFALARPSAGRADQFGASAFRAKTTDDEFARILERDTGSEFEQGEGLNLKKERVAKLMPEVKKRVA